MLIHHTFSEVFAFLPSNKDSVSKLVGVALAQCENAGLASLLPQMLPNLIFGKYKSLVRFAPLDRHPTTVNLKEICATLRVCIFRGFALSWTKLIFIQKSGFPGFGKSYTDTKLQMFWDTYTWEILNTSPSAHARLTIGYVKLI